MRHSLFDIPACAEEATESGFPAGGFGGGHFTHDRQGDFRHWRIHPGLLEDDHTVIQDQFHVWARQGRHTTAYSLKTYGISHFGGGGYPDIVRQRCLFPFTWTAYSGPALPIQLETLAFSPLLPGQSCEASLPVYVVVFRAYNPTDEPMEAALMLTWACGWPYLVSGATFDFQHDKLCLTGALGDPKSPNRQGIAVPDLHYEGIYLQGIEPWEITSEAEWELWNDFAEDGELDPAIARGTPQGAAAWVKFELEPDETKEIPFVLVWHFPLYESGPAIGQPRYYTQFLGKRRPDNAIVWLAEQVVQDYGQETANYRYWIQQIQDWQRPILENPLLSHAEKRQHFNGLAALLDADTVWTDDGRFTVLLREGQTWEDLRTSLSGALPLADLWPDIARQLPPGLHL